MKIEYIIGIFGILATISAPILAVVYSAYRKKKAYISLSTIRAKALTRTKWSGHYVLDKRANIDFFFTYKKKIIQGEARYTLSSGPTTIIFSGGFYSDSLLKLDYKNSEQHKLQFGTIILELNGDGTRLEGGLVAYGRYPDQIYYGSMVLEPV